MEAIFQEALKRESKQEETVVSGPIAALKRRFWMNFEGIHMRSRRHLASLEEEL